MYKVVSECGLNSWPDSSNLIDRGFKFHPGQRSIAASKNHSVVNSIYSQLLISRTLRGPSKMFEISRNRETALKQIVLFKTNIR